MTDSCGTPSMELLPSGFFQVYTFIFIAKGFASRYDKIQREYPSKTPETCWQDGRNTCFIRSGTVIIHAETYSVKIKRKKQQEKIKQEKEIYYLCRRKNLPYVKNVFPRIICCNYVSENQKLRSAVKFHGIA